MSRTSPENLQVVRFLGEYVDVLRSVGIVASVPAGAGVMQLAIEYATDDSRTVVSNTLFVCKGRTFKREYLLGAIEAGAVAYVSETDYGVDIPCVLVTNIRLALGAIADFAFDHPSGRLSVCAFTGTKGKTTSSYYLKGIFDAEAVRSGAHRPGMLTSIGFDDGVESGVSKLTTPESFQLEQRLANAAHSGARRLVMEASSQALKYERTYGVEFAVGAFTNIGEDHISPIEHPTFEDYFSSKLKLFAQSRVAVVNLDMDMVDRVLDAARASERTVTYSLEDPAADVFVTKIARSDRGVVATVRTPRFERDILIPTPVRFNMSNALAAIACAEALQVDEESIVHGLEDVRVPGRMELYPTESGMIVGVVDYAHNGMSLETMLRDLRENYPDRELVTVFGATGGKGADRRETMGVAAGKFADRIVITEDDPGPEDPADICNTIAHFVEEQGNHAWQIVLDREEAIRTAVFETIRPSVVVVTGKGQETRMLRKNGAEPCEADGPMLQRALDAFEQSHQG